MLFRTISYTVCESNLKCCHVCLCFPKRGEEACMLSRKTYYIHKCIGITKLWYRFKYDSLIRFSEINRWIVCRLSMAFNPLEPFDLITSSLHHQPLKHECKYYLWKHWLLPDTNRKLQLTRFINSVCRAFSAQNFM